MSRPNSQLTPWAAKSFEYPAAALMGHNDHRNGLQHHFRTLDPNAESTRFVVWNDTHENPETLKALHKLTEPLKPDFLLWNGDQSNDVHFAKDMKMTKLDGTVVAEVTLGGVGQ